VKLKLLHHAAEVIPGEYESPPSTGWKTQEICRVRRDASGQRLAFKFCDGGTGIWDRSGKLLYFIAEGADLCWDEKSGTILSLELRRYGPCKGGNGIGHALRRLDMETFRVTAEMEICIPFGEVNYLVLDSRGNRCLATWAGHGAEWGYIIVNLIAMKQLPQGFTYSAQTVCPPEFSPDDKFIVSCNPVGDGWWADDNDNYCETPSAGGSFDVGVISVHDLALDAVTNHVVGVDLPEGWLPDRPECPEWNQIWGPEFVGVRDFRFWLPDDSIVTLKLPLPPRIEIAKEIGTERQWLDD
jgi:hypothetical protein